MAEDNVSHSDGHAPTLNVNATVDRRVQLIEHVQRLNPPSYSGTEGPEKAEQFLHRLEKIFRLIGCGDEEKLVLAEYFLQGEADHWWEVTRGTIKGYYQGIPWQKFRQTFLDKYFPYTMREAKAREFETLVQGDMSVDEHERKFTELSRYAPHLVSTPELKARRYEQSLNLRIRNQLTALMLTSYEELYHRAQRIEMTLREGDRYDVPKGNTGASSSSGGVRRFFRGSSFIPNSFRKASSSGSSRMTEGSRGGRPMHPPSCNRCGRAHGGPGCPGMGLTCFECGRPGHIRSHCPQRTGNRMGSSSSSGSRPGWAPNPTATRGSANVPRGTGRVNVVTREEASASKDTMAGMILVNGCDAFALFDTGATHSFMSWKFVERNGIEGLRCGEPLGVWLPNGEQMVMNCICEGCEVMVNTLQSWIDLVVFQIKDFDVILGMDWLRACHATVDCIRREILFKVPGQPSCTYVGQGRRSDGFPLLAASEVQRILKDGEDAYLAVVLNLK